MATELKKQNPLKGTGKRGWIGQLHWQETEGPGREVRTHVEHHSHGGRLLGVVSWGPDDGKSILQRCGQRAKGMDRPEDGVAQEEVNTGEQHSQAGKRTQAMFTYTQ